MGERLVLLNLRDVVGAGLLAAGIALATAGPVRSESPNPSVIPQQTPIQEHDFNDSGIPPIAYGVGIVMVFAIAGSVIYAASSPEAQVPDRK